MLQHNISIGLLHDIKRVYVCNGDFHKIRRSNEASPAYAIILLCSFCGRYPEARHFITYIDTYYAAFLYPFVTLLLNEEDNKVIGICEQPFYV